MSRLEPRRSRSNPCPRRGLRPNLQQSPGWIFSGAARPGGREPQTASQDGRGSFQAPYPANRTYLQTQYWRVAGWYQK